jgi:FolB domain-containing protein
MADRLVIERLELQGFCGVTEPERTAPQPMAFDLELAFDMSPASVTDDLTKTVDYTRVAERIAAIVQHEQFRLLESLSERLVQAILSEFPVREVSLWARKLKPPVKGVRESVGVRISRRAAEPLGSPHGDRPAPWLAEHRRLFPGGRALDLACGQGRNAIYLAQEGFRVEAWDRNAEGLNALQAKAESLGFNTLTTRLVDLEREPAIPVASFDLVIVFYYLQRNLVPHILQALKPGGVVVYETFLIDNHERFDHPRRQEFCLRHNELLSLFGGLRILAYKEGPLDPARGPFLASLVAQRT